jgi:hypothetical protein
MLSSVTSSAPLLPPRILIHGHGKVGKTTFGADAPSPLLMQLEEGAGVLNVPSVPHELLSSYGDAMNVLYELGTEQHEYKTLVIDTIDHLEPLVWNEVCVQGGKGHIEDFGWGKGYVTADVYWIAWFKALDLLRRQGMTVIILCHDEDKIIDDPLVGAYTRTQPKLHKRANALMYEWADVIGYLAIERMARDAGEEGGRTTRTSRATGQRILYLEDTGGAVAGNRFGLPTSVMVPFESPYQSLRSELHKALGVAKKGE